MRRVAITGMGCVSALGLGVDPFWDAVRSGRTGVGPTKLERWRNQRVKISAQVDRDTLTRHFSEADLNTCDPFTLAASVATKEAVAQAGLSKSDLAGPRTGVVVASGVGGLTTIDDNSFAYYGGENRRLDPLTIPRTMLSAAASRIGMEYSVNGPTFAVSSACSSASQAIGVGLQMVRSGVVDRAIVGGSEIAITASSTRAWEMLRVLTPDACRPFSRGRNGMVLGEGAGMFILENPDVARARGAKAIATLAGYGTSSDAFDLLRPDPKGAAAAMQQALADAEIEPNRIGYINAHGTGTVMNDLAETEAVRLAFGPDADGVCISSTKPIHGHALGAAGGLELLVAVKAVTDGFVPPTINWLEADPNCNLDVIPNTGRAKPIEYAMSNSFAFGGINAVLIVGRAE